MIDAIVRFILSVLMVKSKTNVVAAIQLVAGVLVAVLPTADQLLSDNAKWLGISLVVKSVIDAILREKTTQSLASKL